MFIKLTIDRFEEEWAILETRESNPKTFNFPRHLLPKEAKEGAVLNIKEKNIILFPSIIKEKSNLFLFLESLSFFHLLEKYFLNCV